MSVFSIIKRGRQQAKEHSQKQAEQKKKEEAKPIYKHVPTHAAADAISSAPPSWRFEDRQRILEENRRRSIMAACGMSMGMPGIPRVGSSLSHVTYPVSDANPMVHHILRSYNYGGLQTWHEHGADVQYSVPDPPESSSTPSVKGKEVERVSKLDVPRVPGVRIGDPPVSSSSDSGSYREELDVKSCRQIGTTEWRIGRASAQGQPAHRLHPRSSAERVAYENGHAQRHPHSPSTSRDNCPPPSARGFSAIPLSAEPASLRIGYLPGTLPISAATTASTPNTSPSVASSSVFKSSGTSNSSVSSSSVSRKPAVGVVLTPAVDAAKDFDFPFSNNLESVRTPPALSSPPVPPLPPVVIVPAVEPPSQRGENVRLSESMKFIELDFFDSCVDPRILEPFAPFQNTQRELPQPVQNELQNEPSRWHSRNIPATDDGNQLDFAINGVEGNARQPRGERARKEGYGNIGSTRDCSRNSASPAGIEATHDLQPVSGQDEACHLNKSAAHKTNSHLLPRQRLTKPDNKSLRASKSDLDLPRGPPAKPELVPHQVPSERHAEKSTKSKGGKLQKKNRFSLLAYRPTTAT